MPKRTLTLLAATLVSGAGLTAAPSAFAASRDTPAVQSVALQSSETSVTSSTGRKLQVMISASKQTASSTGADVVVAIRNGTTDRSELHQWTFPVDGTALTVDSTGAGTLKVSSANISPYGMVSLAIAPTGDPITQTCQGEPTSQTQDVSLTGTFLFDTKSTGAHKWGAVGSATKSFTFAATNKLVWSYPAALGAACVDIGNLPCLSGLFWQSSLGEELNLTGVAARNAASLFASRTVTLDVPANATRNDESFATTKKLVLKQAAGGGASLSLAALTNSSGAAKLTGAAAATPFSEYCRKGGKRKVETTTTWSNASYKNAKAPLTVHAQIFGGIKLANNTNSSFSLTELT